MSEPEPKSENEHFVWCGVPAEDLSADQLRDVIQFLSTENRELRQDRDRWRECGDAAKYLMLKKPAGATL